MSDREELAIVCEQLGIDIHKVGTHYEDQKLIYLYLNKHGLIDLPEDLFDNFSSLRYLNLNNNHISLLPLGIFDQLTSLRKLYLENNRINELPKGIFDKLTSLGQLKLSGNTIKIPLIIESKTYSGSEISNLKSSMHDRYEKIRLQNINNEEIEMIHATQKILKIITQVRVDIPMTLPRISELVELEKMRAEKILNSILDKQPDLGEYLPLEQVFIKKSEVKEEIFNQSTFTDSLQECKTCGDSQSILIRICTNCGEALPHCNICKRGFAEKDQITNCPECGNPFHRTHLIAQVQSSGNCPVCRKPLTLSQVS